MGVLLLAAVSLMLLISIVAAVRAVMLALRVRRFRKAVLAKYGYQLAALHEEDEVDFEDLKQRLIAYTRQKENPRGNQDAD